MRRCPKVIIRVTKVGAGTTHGVDRRLSERAQTPKPPLLQRTNPLNRSTGSKGHHDSTSDAMYVYNSYQSSAQVALLERLGCLKRIRARSEMVFCPELPFSVFCAVVDGVYPCSYEYVATSNSPFWLPDCYMSA